jgi:hypothetical protein
MQYSSLAKWLIMLIHRAIILNHEFVSIKQGKLESHRSQLQIEPAGKLIMFKVDIQPYWAELTNRLKSDTQTTESLYREVEAKSQVIIDK